MKETSILTLCFFFILSLHSCKSSSDAKPLSVTKGEYIYRRHNEELFTVDPPIKVERDAYAWEGDKDEKFPKITKYHFRCKGDLSHPAKIIQRGTESLYIYDCGGVDRHTLPIKDGKEFVYPILIDLLNYLQKKTGNKVVVTCGHCCPEHNTYLDDSSSNQASKHMLAAEVDFYVQGMESEPEKVIELIQGYYLQSPQYKDLKEYTNFERYKSEKTNVGIQPWYNKEIFVKLVQKTEGRDFDNCHSHAYISIQVRYDRDVKETVSYSWDKAFRNFYRR